MRDRNVQFPNRYRMTKVAGTDDIYDLVPAPGTVYEEGDFLNKSTLLTDALCTALSLPTTATPTQALEKLRQLVATAQSTAIENNAKVVSGSYVGTGSGLSESKPVTFTVPFMAKLIMIPYYKDNSSGKVYNFLSSCFILSADALTTSYLANVGFCSFPATTDLSTKLFAKKSADGKVFNWYILGENNPHVVLNLNNCTYYFLAIG